MIIVFKKRVLVIVTAVLLILAAATGATVAAVSAAKAENAEYCVVLDAGHGGIDNGVVGVNTKQTEAKFNLAMVKLLGKKLEALGNYKVVYTRTSDEDLSDGVKNYKKRDMAARKKIINDSSPDLVVSIHANKFPNPSRRGAQVFFDEFGKEGKLLANALQVSLNTLNVSVSDKSYEALKGDYFILKCSPFPSAIVECGFLSNPDDDALLATDEYREKLAYQIQCGIIAYLGNKTAPTFDTEI